MTTRSLIDIRRRVLMEVIPMASTRMPAKDYIERSKKIGKASKLCDRFFERMQTQSSFETEAEAINKLAPVAVWFIGWAARRFAIMVIKALWREWHVKASV
jgi:hypothetical protein